MSRLLDKIDSPACLKTLANQKLEQLADEIRQELIATVSITGGHLASSLGVVELTIALHRVFDSPSDKIIWDVGHQSYAHKLITGRRQQFQSLRQHGGLSGFVDRLESLHDPFGSGHASTSLSAALGMATARDLSKQDYSVVAVIGDGALAGGMAFEALNHIGQLGTRLIVVLNDNRMSISPTVGALARLSDKLQFDHYYDEAERKAKRLLSIFSEGGQLWQAGKKIKRGFKGLILPSSIWEELGFTYMGLFDGHDTMRLEAAFNRARDYSDKPVFIHVITTKGKGYLPAEVDAVRFHGISGRGERSKVAPTYSEVFAQTLLKIMRQNPKVVVITAAMSEGNGLSIICDEFPERAFDVGICEQHAVTMAAGLAAQGFIPVVAIYSTFLQRAFDQIIHDVCLQELPVVLALDRGGIVGEDGKTHQGIFDISYLSLIPNLIVAAPKDENELQHLFYTAIESNHPMAIRYPRGQGLNVTLDPSLHELPIGVGEILRSGKNLAILAIGTTVFPAVEAAEQLAELGVEATVINARYAKPLDSKLIIDVCKIAKYIVTVEENVLSGGFGSGVIELLHQAQIHDVKVKNIGIPDCFVEQGNQNLLRTIYNLDAQGIVKQTMDFFPELALKSYESLQVI